jgi:hypothetical protein
MTLPTLPAGTDPHWLKRTCDLATAIDSIYRWDCATADWPLFEPTQPHLHEVGTVMDHVFATQNERTQYVADSALPHVFWDSDHTAARTDRSATGIINTDAETVRWIAGYRDTRNSIVTTIDLTITPAATTTHRVEIVDEPTITFESMAADEYEPTETAIRSSTLRERLPSIRQRAADHIAAISVW